MNDNSGRNIHYLRISLTDRCNLRCRYCMPEEGVLPLPHQQVLRFEEIERLVGIMAELGVNRIRLTGGEPLVRKNVTTLAQSIKEIDSIGFLGITTNGTLLEEQAEGLYQAGVDGINISLDTTNPQRYQTITRRNRWAAAWAGLQKALEVPFKSVKVNCVLAPDSIPEDWLSVVELAKQLPIDVRLIEWMPMGGASLGPKPPTGAEAMSAISERFGPLTPVEKKEKGGPAQYFQLEGFKGSIGFISALSHNFCSSCNRLRLTATGDLKLCLFYDSGISLGPLLRGGASDSEIRHAIETAVKNKPLRHQGQLKTQETGSSQPLVDRPCGMFGIGG